LKVESNILLGLFTTTFRGLKIQTEKQKELVEKNSLRGVNARNQFATSSLADLYDPNLMPPELLKAHHALIKPLIYVTVFNPFQTKLNE
jgi:hypothetical protein